MAFLVRSTGRGPGAFIHWLPVDRKFTLEAGRSIWGFPKELAEIPLDLSSRIKRCAVRLGGRTVIELAIRPGLPLPGALGDPRVDAYSCLDGVTRRTPWTMSPRAVRARPGGATVRLGDHPVAEELRRLGLDRARALVSSTVGHLAMSVDDAEDVRC